MDIVVFDSLAWILFFSIFAGILGLLIGSFLNVVVYRVPNGLSIVSPPSACPNCGASIRSFDNIPVISWFVLRGKCRDCAEPISARYPIVEAATGLFFAGVIVWRWQALEPAINSLSAPTLIGSILETVAYLYLAAISVALFLIDLDTRRLPNAIVLPSYAVGIVLLGASAILTGSYSNLLTAGIGMAALFLFYFILVLIRPGGMGFGDVKLAGVLGLHLGWLGIGPLVVGAFAAFLLGGIFSVALLLVRKANRTSAIPFGPWMLIGAWVGIIFGNDISAGYLALVGLS